MRDIALKGTDNMRDLGGLQAAGGTVRACKLLRGGHLHKATKADCALLCTTYKLATIIDLRTSKERSEKPDVDIAGVRNMHIPIFDTSMPGITHEHESDAKVSIIDRFPDMPSMYAEMMQGDCRENLAAAVHAIIDACYSDGSVLFHCTAGKDRTGIVSLALLSMLGVSYGDILSDYLASNVAARKRARHLYALALVLRRNRADAERVRNVFIVHDTYLAAARSAAESEFGSLEAFVARGLDVNGHDLARFRDAVLERA